MNVTLPYPPSGNRYWRHVGARVVLSAEARAYKSDVACIMMELWTKPTASLVRLEVHMFRPRKAGDLDNTLKVLCDALNGHAWVDDKQIVEIHAYRHDDKDSPRVEVSVEELP